MRFEWDEEKNRRNLAKHRISFQTAKLVFEDPNVHIQEDRVVEGEERWKGLGLIGGILVVLVVHTRSEEGGEDVVRINSARMAARTERSAHDEAYLGSGQGDSGPSSNEGRGDRLHGYPIDNRLEQGGGGRVLPARQEVTDDPAGGHEAVGEQLVSNSDRGVWRTQLPLAQRPRPRLGRRGSKRASARPWKNSCAA